MEKRLLIVEEYLAVELGIFLIGAVGRILLPKGELVIYRLCLLRLCSLFCLVDRKSVV